MLTCALCGAKLTHSTPTPHPHAQELLLCLATGAYFCAPDTACSLPSAFRLHLHSTLHCGSSAPLLVTATTRPLLVRCWRVGGCMSPYLDSHGEEDVELRRGRPLLLSAAGYRQLSHLWAHAGFDFDSYTLHQGPGVEWLQMEAVVTPV